MWWSGEQSYPQQIAAVFNKNKTTTNLQVISDIKIHLLLDVEYFHQAQANTATATVISGWLPSPLYCHFIMVILQRQAFCFLAMHYVFSSLNRFVSVLTNKSKFPCKLLLWYFFSMYYVFFNMLKKINSQKSVLMGPQQTFMNNVLTTSKIKFSMQTSMNELLYLRCM